MSDAAVLNLVLFLPLLGVGAAGRRADGRRAPSRAGWRSP